MTSIDSIYYFEKYDKGQEIKTPAHNFKHDHITGNYFDTVEYEGELYHRVEMDYEYLVRYKAEDIDEINLEETFDFEEDRNLYKEVLEDV